MVIYFYYTKTIRRLEQYYSRFNQIDQTSLINGTNINTVKKLLKSIDFKADPCPFWTNWFPIVKQL